MLSFRNIEGHNTRHLELKKSLTSQAGIFFFFKRQLANAFNVKIQKESLTSQAEKFFFEKQLANMFNVKI